MGQVDPLYNQSNFRFRNDDGDEITATWLAGTDINAIVLVNTVFRLRIRIWQSVNNATRNLSKTFKVRYSLNGGAYTDVAAIGATTSPVRYANSAHVSDGTATTRQLTTQLIYLAGVIDNNNTTGTITFSGQGGQHTELEFILELYGPQLTEGDTIQFRVYETSDVALYNYPAHLDVIATAVFFVLDQSDWRWRDDDGSEAAATWLELAQTDHEVNTTSGDVTRRLRFAVSETANGVATGVTPALYARIEGAVPRARDFIANPTLLSGFATTNLYAGPSPSGGTRVIAVRASSTSLQMTDDLGGIWTGISVPVRNPSFGGSINSIRYGNGVWVAVGTYGSVCTSPDGQSWTLRTTPWGTGSNTDNIQDCFFDGSIWVAVGSDSTNTRRVMTATDPTGTWTLYSLGSGSLITSVHKANGIWVAVGVGGYIATATVPNSTSWTIRTSNTANKFEGVTYVNGVWVAVGSFATIRRATDPTDSWTGPSPGAVELSYIRLWAVGNEFVIGDREDTANPRFLASEDGITWVEVSTVTGDVPASLSSGFYYLATYGLDILIIRGTNTAVGGVFGAWFPVTASSSKIAAVDSTNLTHGADTTQQITSGTFIADNNGVSETGAAGPTNFTGLSKAEYEFAVKFIATDFGGDEVGAEFKVE